MVMVQPVPSTVLRSGSMAGHTACLHKMEEPPQPALQVATRRNDRPPREKRVWSCSTTEKKSQLPRAGPWGRRSVRYGWAPSSTGKRGANAYPGAEGVQATCSLACFLLYSPYWGHYDQPCTATHRLAHLNPLPASPLASQHKSTAPQAPH